MRRTTQNALPARTHLRLCLAAARTGSAAWAILLGLAVMAMVMAPEGMGTARQLTYGVLIGLMSSVVTTMFSLTTEQLRVFGIGRDGARMHVVLATVAGTAIYLVVISSVWGVRHLWAGDGGPRVTATMTVVLLIAAIHTLVRFGEINSRDVGRRRPTGRTRRTGRWASLAVAVDGHRRVMESMATAGIGATVAAYAVVMIPVQGVLRVIFDVDPALVGTLVVIALCATTLLIRVVQAGAAAEMWLAFGGAVADWQRAVLRYWWSVPLSFVAVYSSGWLLEAGLLTAGWDDGAVLFRPESLGDLAGTVILVASCGLATVAATVSILSVTMTELGRWRNVVVPVVVFAVAALCGVIVMVGMTSPSALHGVVIGAVTLTWFGVARLLFRAVCGHVSMGVSTGVANYFGVRQDA